MPLARKLRQAHIEEMQDAAALNDAFGIPGVLVFDEATAGMPRLRVATDSCQAELFLQGAHLAQWQPAGHSEVLFLSSKSNLQPGKAIRGGIPVIYPWFGSPANSPVRTTAGATQHGFARVWPWTLRFAAVAGNDVHLSLTLDQNEGIRSLGFSGLDVVWEAVLGKTLTVRLTVANRGASPCLFEEALHAYFAIGDIQTVSVEGLGDTDYLDKTENFARKHQTDPQLRFHGEVDRPYLNTAAPLLLDDPTLRRRIRLTKLGSNTTVTWNPGSELAAKLSDLAVGDWQHFVCLETANVAENAVLIAPGEAHVMGMHLELESL